jgi:hypothetical protein
MEKRLNGPIKSESKPKTVATKKEIKPVVLVSDESELEREERVREKYNVETRIKNADLEKKEIDLQIAKVKLAKTMGDVIPTDMVKDLFAQQFKSVTTSFHQAADNFIMDIAKRAGLKRDDIADLRGKLIEMINEGIVEAQIESKKAVRVIVKDYSEKRGVGERK